MKLKLPIFFNTDENGIQSVILYHIHAIAPYLECGNKNTKIASIQPFVFAVNQRERLKK